MNRTLSVCALIILSAPMTGWFHQNSVQGNHAPSVKIISPADRAVFKTGTPVSYQIGIADPEDGDSKFDEINAKEVLLEVKYIRGNPGITTAIRKRPPDDAPGLTLIAISNCFNCHNFNSKSIGPSFFEIGKRYSATKAHTDTLTRHIQNGSSGIWGKEKMPSHPELTAGQIKTAVEWILKNASARDVSYYYGESGLIQFSAGKKGSYLLTASYTDHGTADVPAKRLRGFDRISLKLE